MFLIRTVFLLSLLLYPLRAIVSIAPVELGEDPGISGKVGLSLSTKRGNSDVDFYKFASRITYDNNTSYLTWLQIAGEYGEANNEKSVQKIYAHLRYIHNISDKYHVYEIALQSEDDEFRLIKVRRLIAAGYRHHFAPASKFKLFTGAGLLYEFIKFTTTTDPTERNFRASLYASIGYNFKEGMEAILSLTCNQNWTISTISLRSICFNSP